VFDRPMRSREQSNRTVVLTVPMKLFPVSIGGQARIWSLLKWLSESGYDIELITLSYDREYNQIIERYVKRIWVLNSHYVDRKACGTAFSPDRFPGLSELVEVVCKTCRPCAVIAEFVDVSHTLDKVPFGILRILDTHDVHYLRRKSFEKVGKRLTYDLSLEEEIGEWSRADIILAIQSEEKEFIQKMCPNKTVILAEHAIESPEMLGPPAMPNEILFVGNLYEPNVDGLRAFLNNVWPFILKNHPETKLNVCGRVCQGALLRSPGVFYLGEVPDLRPYYAAATVVINPVMYGSGLKIKTVEALAYGKCLVTTKEGISGIGPPAKDHCIMTTVDECMAEKIGDIIEDPQTRKRIEEKAFEFAKRQFSPSACFKELHLVLSSTAYRDSFFDNGYDMLEVASDPDRKKRVVKERFPEDIIADDIECYVHRETRVVDQHGEKGSYGECPVMMCFPCTSPPDNWDLYNKGIYLKNIRRFEAAIKEFEKIGEGQANHIEAKYHKGAALAALGRYDEAMRCLEAVEAMEPDRTDVKLSKSDLFKYMKKYDQALAMISEVERIDAENDIIHFKRILIWGGYLKDIGLFEEAIGVFDKISEESPNYSEMRCQKGLALAALGRSSEAIECFREVSTTYPIRPVIEREINEVLKNMEEAGPPLPLRV